MALWDLSLADWARLGDEAARRECEQLARTLPHGLKLASLKEHSYCGRTHRVARFDRREAGDLAHFVLVPGGEVSLGFDGRDFNPQPWQIASYHGWPEELLKRGVNAKYVRWSIKDFVDLETSAPRTVWLQAMLIEVEAHEIEPRQDIEPLSEGDPMFEHFRDPKNGNGEYWGGVLGEFRYIVKRDEGSFQVWRRPPTTLRYVEARLAKSGMRLPTGDEWEHACGGEAKTLFRWGHDTPSDFYPTDTCAKDRELKRAWALSRGKLHYETPPPSWDLHDQLNLFGLRIANDPYKMDLVSDEPWELGGDGGNYICGASSIFLGWLPLATAYRRFGRSSWFDPDTRNVADDYHQLRRIIPLE